MPTKRKSTVAKTTAPISSPTTSFQIKKPYLIAGITILAAVALGYYFKSFFVVAIVNGQPITRLSIIQQLEKQGGKQVLNVAVTKVLIEQEARQKSITVSQKEMDDELKKTETSLAAQGQSLDQALATQGMTRNDYVDQVRLQLLLQKLVGKNVAVSDKEVTDYVEQNKASIPETSNMDEVRKSVTEQLKQQKLNAKVQTLLEELQKKAKINYFLNY